MRQLAIVLETLLLMFACVAAGTPALLFVVAGIGGWASSRYDAGVTRRPVRPA